MAQKDYSKYFKCPDCGKVGAIYVLKITKDIMIFKQKCPHHKGRVFKLSLDTKDEIIHLIRDGVFRCYECGEKITASSITIKSPWALINCSCPTHGKMPIQKIWNSIYKNITSKEVVENEPSQSEIRPKFQQVINPINDMKFCPYCGASIEKNSENCKTCGSPIE